MATVAGGRARGGTVRVLTPVKTQTSDSHRGVSKIRGCLKKASLLKAPTSESKLREGLKKAWKFPHSGEGQTHSTNLF